MEILVSKDPIEIVRASRVLENKTSTSFERFVVVNESRHTEEDPLMAKLDIEHKRRLYNSVKPAPRPKQLPPEITTDLKCTCQEKRNSASFRYPGKETHAMRHRKQQQREIAQENQRMFQRLNDVWREPIARFHAPSGGKSVRQGRLQSATTRKVRGDEWPAVPPSDYAFTKGLYPGKSRMTKEREKEIARGNEALRQKILEPFKGRRVFGFLSGYQSYAETMGTQPVDVKGRWIERLSHYEDTDQIIPRRRPGTAPSYPGADPRALSGALASTTARENVEAEIDRLMRDDRTLKKKEAPSGVKVSSKGIPKTLTMASCCGCGDKSFFLGDGKDLFRCPKCDDAYYCSRTCQEIDWPHHRTTCKGGIKATAGTFNQFSGVGQENLWAANGAMAEARRLLKKKEEIWGPMNSTKAIRSIQRRYGVMREREVLRETEMRLVADMQGMDLHGGPRPCMHFPKSSFAP